MARAGTATAEEGVLAGTILVTHTGMVRMTTWKQPAKHQTPCGMSLSTKNVAASASPFLLRRFGLPHLRAMLG